MRESVLFLCTGNSCRSQMAEALLNTLRSDRFEAYSAGVSPKGIDPLAVEVMKEIGIDISTSRSKDVEEFKDMEFDYVITLCDNAKDACPFFPARKKVLHKPFEDPPVLAAGTKDREEIYKIYRKVRDDIKDFVLNLESYL